MMSETQDLVDVLGVLPSDADGMSVEELVGATGLGRTALHKKLRQLMTDGRCECSGFREGTRIDGCKCRKPVYRLIGAPEAKAKRRKR